jgi:hypothetical protein
MKKKRRIILVNHTFINRREIIEENIGKSTHHKNWMNAADKNGMIIMQTCQRKEWQIDYS